MPPASAANVRAWPAVAVETPKSPATSGRIAVSTRKLAWEANIVANSTGAGRRSVIAARLRSEAPRAIGATTQPHGRPVAACT